MALIASFIFASCALAADGRGPSADPRAGAARARCVEVAPLDDRYPLVVSVGSLDNLRSGLEDLQRSRARERSCIRFALAIRAAPQAVLASLHGIALEHPELLIGIAVIPLSAPAQAPALLWHLGHELRFPTLDAATVAATAYLP
jgi:hypothetical protein